MQLIINHQVRSSYMQSLFSHDIALSPDTGSTYMTIAGNAPNELQWQCADEELSWSLTVLCDSALFPAMLIDESGTRDSRINGIYYYHTDHLGSASWITRGGEPVQYIQYMPYGEIWCNQRRTVYNERFQYTGKELDMETGYNFFGARNYMSDVPTWLSSDPLSDKYPNISPYAYCGWNPMKYVDPMGEAWRPTYSYDAGGNISPNGFEWVDESKSYDKNGNLLSGLYQQAIFFSDNGTYSPQNKYNIGSSTAFVYLADGTTQEFAACTYPSDINTFPTIPEGNYEAYVGMHHGRYLALKMRDVGASTQTIELGSANPAHPNRTYVEGVDIHYAGKNNFTAIGKDGRAVSEACFLINRNQWDSFISNFTYMPRGAKIGIQASRTLFQPINVNRYPAYNFIYNGFRNKNFYNIWR